MVDCGYGSGENIRFLEENGLDGYMPNRIQARELNDKEPIEKSKYQWDDYEYDWKTDVIIFGGVRLPYYKTFDYKNKGYKMHEYRSSGGKIIKRVPEFFRERLRMKKKMETEKAEEIYALRKNVVEPVIGDIKENFGFRGLRLKGLDGAKLELNLVSIAHNLKKIWAARGRLIPKDKNIIFNFIVCCNYLNCDTACEAII